ncbi:zinc finger protein Xfin-like [Cloeon dipterum]|uniref:zinc finger protein Xfin-like n=1 Tax=Cloeon dipterum TaxID=197152 RepID=UPI00321F84EC
MDHRDLESAGVSNFDDDDTHFCLKCQNTVVGLDNYILHRRSKCGGCIVNNSSSKENDRNAIPTEAVVENTVETPVPSALDFFSSLELMSKQARLEEFDIDFDIPPLTKSGLEISSKGNSFLRITDLELEPSTFNIDIVDINKVRRGNFDSLADLNLMQEDSIIGIDRGRSILDSDIFSTTPIEKMSLPPAAEDILEPLAVKQVQLPPIQSSGKWMPGKNDHLISGSTIHYFCRTCNRNLSSRTQYEKHLRSELHFKRKTENSFYEMEQEFLLPAARSKRGRRMSDAKAKEVAKPVAVKLCEKIPGPNKKYNSCEICNIKVPSMLFGKHLLSHYHYIKGCQNPQLAKELVLNNIDKVVKHFSFQCHLCHFYCNMMDDFLAHFESDLHLTKNEMSEGKFFCQQCKFEESANESIESHLRTEEHQQVVAALNQSVPIVIRKRSTPFTCTLCSSKFSLNFQLKRHSFKDHGISAAPFQTFSCKHCSFTCNKRRSLQRHCIGRHKKKGKKKQILNMPDHYFCEVCDRSFQSKEEVVLHRRQLECREKRATTRGVDTKQFCRICQGVFDTLVEFKQHMTELHPGALHRCHKCNQCFAISQDLSRHSRVCKLSPGTVDRRKFFCTTCQKSFTRIRNLVYHQKNVHGQTEPKSIILKCEKCSFSTFKRSRIIKHLSAIHFKETRTREWMCEICDKMFFEKEHLKLHRKIHFPKELQCGVEGCGFKASQPSVLKKHQQNMHEEGSFKCETLNCSFVAATKFGMKRHSQIHDIEKTEACDLCSSKFSSKKALENHKFNSHSRLRPFMCPHCDLDFKEPFMVRNHILKTKKHSGKFVYNCLLCEMNYTTNCAKEFKCHLQSAHSIIKFQNGSVLGYCKGFLENRENGGNRKIVDVTTE